MNNDRKEPRLPASVDLQQRLNERLAGTEFAGSTVDASLSSAAAGGSAFDAIAGGAADAAAMPAAAPTPADVVAAPPPVGATPDEAPTASTKGPAATAIAKAQTEADAAAGKPPERGADGKFVAAAPPATPADVVLGAEGAPPAGTPPAGAPAEEKPAVPAPAAPVDWETLEIDSGVPDVTWQIQAPKAQADEIKRGYLRQADYTKKTMALAKHRDFLMPLLQPNEQGQIPMDSIQPMIDFALKNDQFGIRLAAMWDRFANNRPTTFADEVQPGGTPVPGPVPGTPPPPASGEITLESLGIDPADPWVESTAPVLKVMLQRLNAQQTFIDRLTASETQQQTQQQTAHRIRTEGNAARTYIESLYPGEYDDNSMAELYKYANANGYIASAGGSIAAGMLGARQAIDRARAGHAAAHPPIASVAAKTLAQADAEATALARTSAAAIQRAVAPSNGVPTPAAVNTTIAKPALRRADGSHRSAKEVLADAAAQVVQAR